MQNNSYPQFQDDSLIAKIYQMIPEAAVKLPDDFKDDLKTQLRPYANEILAIEHQSRIFEQAYDLMMQLFTAYRKRGMFGFSEVIVSEINSQILKIYDNLKELFQCFPKAEGQALSNSFNDALDEEALVYDLSVDTKAEMKKKLHEIWCSIGMVVGSVGLLLVTNTALRAVVLETIGTAAAALGTVGTLVAGGALLLAGGYLIYRWLN